MSDRFVDLCLDDDSNETYCDLTKKDLNESVICLESPVSLPMKRTRAGGDAASTSGVRIDLTRKRKPMKVIDLVQPPTPERPHAAAAASTSTRSGSVREAAPEPLREQTVVAPRTSGPTISANLLQPSSSTTTAPGSRLTRRTIRTVNVVPDPAPARAISDTPILVSPTRRPHEPRAISDTPILVSPYGPYPAEDHNASDSPILVRPYSTHTSFQNWTDEAMDRRVEERRRGSGRGRNHGNLASDLATSSRAHSRSDPLANGARVEEPLRRGRRPGATSSALDMQVIRDTELIIREQIVNDMRLRGHPPPFGALFENIFGRAVRGALREESTETSARTSGNVTVMATHVPVINPSSRALSTPARVTVPPSPKRRKIDDPITIPTPAAPSASASRSPCDPDEPSCAICLDTFAAIKSDSNRGLASTLCGHIFCKPCLNATIKTNHCCPTCRKKLTLKQIHPVYF